MNNSQWRGAAIDRTRRRFYLYGASAGAGGCRGVEAHIILVNRRRRGARRGRSALALTDLQHVLDAARVQQLEAAAERDAAVVVGRRARQRRVHADVALIPRERPVHDAPLHRLRDALVALLDTLKRNSSGHDLGRDVKQSGRGARPAARARRACRHNARSAARRGLPVIGRTLRPAALRRTLRPSLARARAAQPQGKCGLIVNYVFD
ncbi:hypothetical protein EVAR_10540_1 [Eumeta japonica]|uniref:Uncharacterized protein n=1 Tax=Eumeta variegata TaxID=151549 RepID=A0A4C1TIP0_EUMVA|nr:hypothetical protein EVAR_10540_1 [Eumeta japonica]